MLEREMREFLRALAREIGAMVASVEYPSEDDKDSPEDLDTYAHVPLGGGAILAIYFQTPPAPAPERAAAIEKAARRLRTHGRHWNVDRLPEVSVGSAQTARERQLARITEFLLALANTQHASNTLITLRGDLLATAHHLEEMQRERIDFTLRRLDAEAARSAGTSHAEIVSDDMYAVSFWYGATLIAYFDSAYSVDFVRHRAKLVTREVSAILDEMSDPPPAPASVAPVPD